MAGGVQSLTTAVLALGVTLALAGCETFGYATPGASPGAPPRASSKTAAATTSAPSTAPAPVQARKQTAALVAPQVLDDDPEQLMGLGPARLEALLGGPGLIRREGEAAIWQYRDGACVLDLFLYESGRGPRVTYAEARARDGTGTEKRPCLNGLLRRQLVTVSGTSPVP